MPVFENFNMASLIENGDFESGTTNYWTVQNGGIKTIDSVNKNSGLYSMKLTNGVASDGQVLSNKFKCGPGDVIVIQGFFRNNTTSPTVNLGIIYYYPSGTFSVSSFYTTESLTGSFAFKQVRYVVPQKVGFAQVVVLMNSAGIGDAVNIDDISAQIIRVAAIDMDRGLMLHRPRNIGIKDTYVAIDIDALRQFSVPAGYMWHVNTVSAVSDTVGVHDVYISVWIPGDYYPLQRRKGIAQGESVEFRDFDVYAGDTIYVAYAGLTIGDTVETSIFYEQMAESIA